MDKQMDTPAAQTAEQVVEGIKKGELPVSQLKELSIEELEKLFGAGPREWALASATAVLLGLVAAPADAGPHHTSGGQGSPKIAAMNTGMNRMGVNRSMNQSFRSSCYGNTWRGWSTSRYCTTYGCYCYWCPTASCYYYWYQPQNCYVPYAAIQQYPPPTPAININVINNNNNNATPLPALPPGPPGPGGPPMP